MSYSITIDGPSGGGKSTLAKNLQKKLKVFTLIDTGAYYRWAARICLENEIDVKNKKEVLRAVQNRMDLQFIPYPRGHKYYSAKIYHQGELINKKLYTREVTDTVPVVATYPQLRNLVKNNIRQLAKTNNIIVAGRDIGTDVLPKAEVKIYLNPSVESRARRRYRDEIKQGR
jgi:cytidylate kinase